MKLKLILLYLILGWSLAVATAVCSREHFHPAKIKVCLIPHFNFQGAGSFSEA